MMQITQEIGQAINSLMPLWMIVGAIYFAYLIKRGLTFTPNYSRDSYSDDDGEQESEDDPQ